MYCKYDAEVRPRDFTVNLLRPRVLKRIILVIKTDVLLRITYQSSVDYSI